MNTTTYESVDESHGLVVTVSVQFLNQEELKADDRQSLKWDMQEAAQTLTKTIQELTRV